MLLMPEKIRIGTRESQLAVWQATEVSKLLLQYGYPSELVYIKTEGDINLTSPLYEMGVQGIFTKALDIALLENKIDIAVHSMKDVPVVLAKGLTEAAVLKRASYKDLFVINETKAQQWHDAAQLNKEDILTAFISQSNTIATSSIRRKAQWLHRYPASTIENLRGNVNTRLRKLAESNWHGAIFAAAGLERIALRPALSIALDWMLPAPAQGAILVACRVDDEATKKACQHFNDINTATCVKAERDFLKALSGGCSTPVSALAQIENSMLKLQGSILSVDGKEKISVEKIVPLQQANELGTAAATEILHNGGEKLMEAIRKSEQ